MKASSTILYLLARTNKKTVFFCLFERKKLFLAPCGFSLKRAKSINAWLIAIIQKGFNVQLSPKRGDESTKVEPYIFAFTDGGGGGG